MALFNRTKGEYLGAEPDLIDGIGGAGGAFAAQSLGLANRADALARNSIASGSAAETWNFYDSIGVVRNAVAKQARIAGGATISVMKVGDDGRPTPIFDRGEMPEVVRMVDAALVSPEGGQQGLIERFYELIKIAGFTEIEAVRSGGPQGRDLQGIRLRSESELERKKDMLSNRQTVELIRAPKALRSWKEVGQQGFGFERKEIPLSSIIGQVWVPHPRFSDMPVSQFYAMRSTLQQVIMLQNTITMRLKSRLAMSGIHFFPNGLVDVHVPKTAPEAVRNSTDPLLKVGWLLQSAMLSDDLDDLTQVVGLIMRGEASDIEAYKFVDAQRSILDGDLEMLRSLIDSVIIGLDASRGSVIGRQEQNHFSAWADDSDDLRSNIFPELSRACHGFTSTVLWGEMRRANLSVEEMSKWVVGFDASTATMHVNRVENIRQARSAGVVTEDAYADAIGVRVDEKLDKDSDEYIRWIGQTMKNPYLAAWGTAKFDKIDWEKAATAGKEPGPAKSTPEEAKSGPGKGTPGSPGDQRNDRKKADKPS